MSTTVPAPSRLRLRDVLRVGGAGLRTRPGRVFLSALGIAIGIATMIAVIGISASGQEQLMRQLDRLGTGLLRVEAGSTFSGEEARLPARAVAMVREVEAVRHAGATGTIAVAIRRTDRIPKELTGGITVQAATFDLLSTLDGQVRVGSWLNEATARYPAVVLGSVAAERLGVTGTGMRVWIGDRWFTVIGILGPMPLAPEIERSALIGFAAAQKYFQFDGHPTTIYERSAEESVEAVRALLARTVNPENPEHVAVSRPSDALAARAAAAGTFTGLLLGLGAVALLVGGVGVANTMVISVLERRREIGLRRSLGATRGQIRMQFLTESLILSVIGGGGGLVIGVLVTMAYALMQGWPAVVPPWVIGGTLAATLAVSLIAGIYPAVRASRVPPSVALAMI
ncbi:ABC transporter permease [Nonomuraea cavernae]|uniref:ABC transporter permease n=1 Tax=Nonomuraea cavernae TaxID=2045107 RepID=A0A918DNY6_9ACTN|nr:ABC transporter permease [Nonomuraea cavernae]MCA2189853.1 ABC transporter permease [Nonomuraea cavernae]GGO77685.1 ABC transporter permease [Nonomuraea cavernae]